MAEKEYIERGEIIRRIKLRIDDYNRDFNSFAPKMVLAYKELLNMVEYLPTAEVQEIVRCKDCKFGEYDNEIKMILCKRIYNISEGESVYNSLNDFCSYGAKMDKE